MLVLLGLAFGSSRWPSRPRPATGAPPSAWPSRCLVVTYLIDGLAPIVDGLNTIRWISPFRYYMGDDPLRNGINLGDAAVLAAVAVSWSWP